MNNPVIIDAVRTPIGTAFKGSLQAVEAADLAVATIEALIQRTGIDGRRVDDVILAESLHGGGDLARFAAVSAGLIGVPGQAVNRHCAGSLTAVGSAAAAVMSGMDDLVIAGGVHSASTAPTLTWRRPDGSSWNGMAPTFPYSEDATDDVTLTIGFNMATRFGLSREQMDAWAFRSHQRAVAAMDEGVFKDEIVPVRGSGGLEFSQDEHPRRGSSLEKLASLPPLHPEIENFSITAGNSSGVNDAASALLVANPVTANRQGLVPMAEILAWGAVGVDPRSTGVGAIEAAQKVLRGAGISVYEVDLWEINEAFAAVPLAACRVLDLDENKVNIFGSGCSLGHPVAASGARMLTTLVHELRRRGGGVGVASMCAGGGQGGAAVIRVPQS